MIRNTFSRFLTLGVVIVASMAVAGGCASKPTAKSTVESMSTVGNETAKAKDSIDSAVKALETLTASKADEVKANLASYSAAVAALDSQAKVVKTNADLMKSEGDGFFKDWTGSAEVTPERQAQLTAAYGKIKTEMAAARDAFTPFLASLKDVQSYVALDPTLKALDSISPLVSKARDNSAAVKSQLDAVLNDLNSVRGMLSTK